MCKQITRFARAGIWPAPNTPTFGASLEDCARAPEPKSSSRDRAPKPAADLSRKSRRERSSEQQSLSVIVESLAHRVGVGRAHDERRDVRHGRERRAVELG